MLRSERCEGKFVYISFFFCARASLFPCSSFFGGGAERACQVVPTPSDRDTLASNGNGGVANQHMSSLVPLADNVVVRRALLHAIFLAHVCMD